MGAPLALYVLAAVALLLLAMAGVARMRAGRWTSAARTWLAILTIFALVIVWVMWQRA